MYEAQNSLVGQMREVGRGDSWEAVGLTAEDRKYGNHMCVTDTQGMHRRFVYSHHGFALMSQSHRTSPAANMCCSHTPWALMMSLPYILVT